MNVIGKGIESTLCFFPLTYPEQANSTGPKFWSNGGEVGRNSPAWARLWLLSVLQVLCLITQRHLHRVQEENKLIASVFPEEHRLFETVQTSHGASSTAGLPATAVLLLGANWRTHLSSTHLEKPVEQETTRSCTVTNCLNCFHDVQWPE